MKVIRINKSYRNGISTSFLVVNDDNEDHINDLVEDWCERDPAGHAYGYMASWEFVTDKDEIRKVFLAEETELSERIKILTERRSQVMKEIY